MAHMLLSQYYNGLHSLSYEKCSRWHNLSTMSKSSVRMRRHTTPEENKANRTMSNEVPSLGTHMKTKKALGGCLGLLESFSALLFFTASLEGEAHDPPLQAVLGEEVEVQHGHLPCHWAT